MKKLVEEDKLKSANSSNKHYLARGSPLVPTTPACTWWNGTDEDLSSGKLESTHPFRTIVK